MDLAAGIVKIGVYAAFRQIFNLGRNIVWMFTGTYWEERRVWNSPAYYSKSAHLHNIVARSKFDGLLGPACFMDFMLTHNSFVHPEYVLKDSVSLYQVTKDQAIFVEAPEAMDVWRCQYGSFIRQAQFNYAVKVITMPLHAFHTLAESVGDPKGDLVFVQNTARCGSTLLVRVFEETEECVAFSEPDALNACASFTRDPTYKPDELRRVTQDTVRLLCKPYLRAKNPTKAYLLKLTIMSMDGVPLLKDIYPKSHHVFMYRDCLKVAESLMRIKEVLPMLKVAYTLVNDKIDFTQPYLKAIGLGGAESKIMVKYPFQLGVALWCFVMKQYQDMVLSGTEMAAVAYEDIADDPDFALGAIMDYCKLPKSMLIKGMKALEKDAQDNSVLASSNIRKLNFKIELTPKIRDSCNAFLASYGYPALGRPCIVPGTVTHKNTIHWSPTINGST